MTYGKSEVTKEARSTLRTSADESANPFRVAIGRRIATIRGSGQQSAMAEWLGVHKNTYARWERGEREIAGEALAKLVEAGWDANWLLTGEGDERRDPADTVLAGIGTARQKIADSESGRASQPVQHDLAKIALQLVSEVLDDNHLTLPPEKRAELTLAVFELLQNGVPEAKLLRFVVAAVA